MTVRCSNPRTPPAVRLLLILGLLAGLLAMHGLSADHGSTMAAGSPAMLSDQVAAEPTHAAPEHSPRSEDMSGMAQACVAVLLGGIALVSLLVNPARTFLSQAAPAGRSALHRAGGTLPRPPDLSALCVLRT